MNVETLGQLDLRLITLDCGHHDSIIGKTIHRIVF
jgi:hypothetical protein